MWPRQPIEPRPTQIPSGPQTPACLDHRASATPASQQREITRVRSHAASSQWPRRCVGRAVADMTPDSVLSPASLALGCHRDGLSTVAGPRIVTAHQIQRMMPSMRPASSSFGNRPAHRSHPSRACSSPRAHAADRRNSIRLGQTIVDERRAADDIEDADEALRAIRIGEQQLFAGCEVDRLLPAPFDGDLGGVKVCSV